MVSKTLLISAAVAAVATSGLVPQAEAQYAVTRCGPFFDNMGCYQNADGLNTVQYCSKWGHCHVDNAEAQATGYYVDDGLDADGNPVRSCNTDADCTQWDGAFCDTIETRCAMNLDEADLVPRFGTVTVSPTGSTAAPDISIPETTGAPTFNNNHDDDSDHDSHDNDESSASSIGIVSTMMSGVMVMATAIAASFW